MRSLRIEKLEDRRVLAASPELVADVNRYIDGTEVLQVVAHDDELAVISAGRNGGATLWKISEGVSRAQRIGTFHDGAMEGTVGDFIELGGSLYVPTYFDGAGELWRTDLTVAGTERLLQIPGEITSLYIFNELVFFEAPGDRGGRAQWRTDGTTSGTIELQLTSFYPTEIGRDQQYLAGSGDWLYFVGFDWIHGRELWRTDGTVEGTSLAADILPGPATSNPMQLIGFSGQVYFEATDVSTTSPFLWQSNGTHQGTRPVTAAADESLVFRPSEMTIANELLYFGLWGAGGYQIWRTDGSDVGTIQLDVFRSSGSPPIMVVLEPYVYYLVRAFDDTQATIRRSDGLVTDPRNDGKHIDPRARN